jgi:hypothetical protein
MALGMWNTTGGWNGVSHVEFEAHMPPVPWGCATHAFGKVEVSSIK